MGCWVSSGPTPGPKQYAGVATSSCTWKFNCFHPWLNKTIPVTCPGTRTGKPYTQKIQMTCTCIIYTDCSYYLDDFDCSYDIHGIEWDDNCDIGGHNCCPDDTIAHDPVPGQPSPPPN